MAASDSVAQCPLFSADSIGERNTYTLEEEKEVLLMSYRARIYYTDLDKALMWDRWQAGDSLREIAQLFSRHHSSIRGIFKRSGGMRP
ncbi:MAG: hypothetical protein DRQ63_10270, partial [Gammaproteobacteria bacterium]